MKFLDIKTDFAFKKVFGSDGSKHILTSVLNALVPFNAVDLRGNAVSLTVRGEPIEPPATQCRALRQAQGERMSALSQRHCMVSPVINYNIIS